MVMSEGIREASRYLFAMRAAAGDKLIKPEGIYSGREGHLRLARECGYALNDFDRKGQTYILQGSYSTIYVSACLLLPILSATEWRAGLLAGKMRAGGRMDAVLQ